MGDAYERKVRPVSEALESQNFKVSIGLVPTGCILFRAPQCGSNGSVCYVADVRLCRAPSSYRKLLYKSTKAIISLSHSDPSHFSSSDGLTKLLKYAQTLPQRLIYVRHSLA